MAMATAVTPVGTETMPQSAAAPSPFTPIAEYAFLSDCHTSALVAPDGAIDWLCVPSFDSPSIFGTLLDRQGGFFRLGPFGINVPSARHYEPGTNTLVTTWHVAGAWVEVRDALTLGPRTIEDTITPHTRPPADDDADHLLVRTVECIAGSVDIDLICEPVFDYGRTPGRTGGGGDPPPSRGGGFPLGGPPGRGGRCRPPAAPPTPPAPASPCGCAPTCPWAWRAAACARATPSAPASACSARCPGP